MHKPVEEHLEEYLRDALTPGARAEFDSHVGGCEACRREVESMAAQGVLLRRLAAPESMVAAPEFYAKVLAAVEARRRGQLAYAFLDPGFGRRLAYAGLTAVLLLGSYLVYTERAAPSGFANPFTFLASEPSGQPHVGSNPQQDRETVLLSLASYTE